MENYTILSIILVGFITILFIFNLFHGFPSTLKGKWVGTIWERFPSIATFKIVIYLTWQELQWARNRWRRVILVLGYGVSVHTKGCVSVQMVSAHSLWIEGIWAPNMENMILVVLGQQLPLWGLGLASDDVYATYLNLVWELCRR